MRYLKSCFLSEARPPKYRHALFSSASASSSTMTASLTPVVDYSYYSRSATEGLKGFFSDILDSSRTVVFETV